MRLYLPFFRTAINRFFATRARIKLLVLGLLGTLICTALYLLTYKSVSYFHSQSELGIILSMKIFQMAWITIFAMLIFSSMIAGVSTLYLSHDNEIIVAAPVSLEELFRMRMFTTFLNTSWMMLLFSLPIFGAFGVVFSAGPLYWPLLAAAVPATAFTASGSAMLFVIVLVYLFPARRTKDIIVYLSICFGVFLYLIFRLMRPEDLVNPEKYGQFVEYMSAISNPAGFWLPASWTSNMLSSYLLDRDIDFLLVGFWLTFMPAAFHKNFAFIAGVIPEENIHQGRLARSVFTQQGMNFPGIDVKINVIVRQYAWKTLHDSTHFQRLNSWQTRREKILIFAHDQYSFCRLTSTVKGIGPSLCPSLFPLSTNIY